MAIPTSSEGGLSVNVVSVSHVGALAAGVSASISVVHAPLVGESVALAGVDAVLVAVSVGPSLGVASTDSVSVSVI